MIYGPNISSFIVDRKSVKPGRARVVRFEIYSERAPSTGKQQASVSSPNISHIPFRNVGSILTNS